MEGPEIKQFVSTLCATISCLLSFIVLLTFVFFKRMRSKLFMRIIAYVSLCDLIANATIFVGVPSDFYLCFFQGILQQYFYPASWLWTTMLMFLLYSLVLRGKILVSKKKMMLICWGLPLLCALLPLSTDTYKASDTDDDWCWITPHHDGSFQRHLTVMWQVLTFDILINVCFVLMIGWGLRIYWKLHVEKLQCTPQVLAALQSLFAYPVLLIICWLPNELMLILYPHKPADNPYVVVVNSLSICHGGFAALYFFCKSKEFRTNWSKLLRNLRIYGSQPERIFSFDSLPDQRVPLSTEGSFDTGTVVLATTSTCYGVGVSFDGNRGGVASSEEGRKGETTSSVSSSPYCSDFFADEYYMVMDEDSHSTANIDIRSASLGCKPLLFNSHMFSAGDDSNIGRMGGAYCGGDSSNHGGDNGRDRDRDGDMDKDRDRDRDSSTMSDRENRRRATTSG